MTHPKAACSPADLATVEAVMQQHAGPLRAAPIGVIVQECGINERKVRAALSALDGVLFLQGEVGEGRFLARTPEEAASMTARIRSRALDELVRLRRRRRYASAMALPQPVEQLSLFAPTPTQGEAAA